MATYAQTPGLLNIKAVTGTDFSCQLDFDASLVGYTFDSAIVLQDYPTKREQSITVTVDNAAQGIITLSLTDAQTSALGTFSKKKWYLNWTIGTIKQTILAGNFELSDIPLGQNEVTSTGVTINTQSVDITLSAFSNAALDGKQPLNVALTQISGLSPNNDDFLQRKSGAWTSRSVPQVKTDLGISNVDNTSDLNKPISTATQSALNAKLNSSAVSAFGLTLIDDIDAATARSTLGLGSAAVESSSSFQPSDSDLTSIASLSPSDDDVLQRKSGAWTNRNLNQLKVDMNLNNVDNTSDADKPLSTATNNALSYKVNTNQISTFGYSLVDDADASAARATLALGSMSQQSASNVNITGGNAVLSNPLGLASGGTNSILTGVNGGIVYSTPSALAISATGTSGQFLRSNGAGAPSWDTPSATATSTTVFNDNSTNREYFPVFAYQSAGTTTTLYGSSAKLKFNPSNGYFTADGGIIADSGNLQLRDGGIYWGGGVVFNAENQEILPNDSGTAVAVWNSTNGMRVTGTATKDVPLRLMDSFAGNLATGSYIIVRPSASATTNGTELRNAYAAAKTFTPNSLALSATNRATVLLLPGRYDLGTTPLTMDTEFVDLVGLSEEPRHVFITSQVILSDSGTIVQTADNVVIRNVSIDRTGAPAGSGAGRTAAYFPNRTSTAIQSWTSNGTTATVTSNGHGLQNGDSVRITGSGNASFDGAYTITRIDDNSFSFASTVNSSGSIGTATERFDDTYIENCRFSGDNDSSMRRSVEYSGTYRRCIAGNTSFAQLSVASGLFEDCIAGNESFGGSSSAGTIASGTFKRCQAGTSSFGFFLASGTFENCTGGSYSFGSANSASGIFTDCTLNSAFSYGGTFTGTMRRCRFITTGTNANALRVGDGAKIFDSTLIATGTGNSITAGSAATISLAGCRMNRDVNANVSNNLGTLTESYNLIDADID